MFTVVITHDDCEEGFYVTVNNIEVVSVNHDDDGWSGIEKVRLVFERLAKLGLCIIEESYSEEE
jgi:hypothetical protein